MNMNAEEFLARVEAGETRFAGLKISGADLTALSGMDLTLKDCCFEDTDFSNAQLEGLRCDGGHFINCKFVDACLREAAFTETSFYRGSTKTVFWRADLRFATFTRCDLRMGDFERAELFRAEFDRVNGLGANFFMARFNSAVKIVDSQFRYAVFTGAQLEKCTLTNNVFIQAVFAGAKLAEAVLIGCDLSGATWPQADLTGADVRGANIASLDVRTMDLTGLKILESQQHQLLETAEIIVFPDNAGA